MDGFDAKKKHSKTGKKDPRVTISDSLIIDVDGILDNDDEVSLETPVTIPENPEPSEFGRAVTDALVPSAKKASSESERSAAVRFSSVKDGSAKGGSVKVSNIQEERKPPPVIKSKLKSTLKLDRRLASEVNSDNLSDSTVSTSNKTSGGSRTSSTRASQKVLRDAKVPKRRLNGRAVEKRIGKAKLPNGFNDVTDASANPSLEEEKSDMKGNGEDRPPILAPWDEKSKKTNSAKNKPRKIDIDELQKDMGKIENI